jgi:hypothetical protein
MFGAVLTAQTYLPLDAGNQWVYRSSGPGTPVTFVVTVEKTETIGGKTWSYITGLPGFLGLWLRNAEGDGIWMLDPDTKAEKRYVNVNGPVGQPFPTAVDPCNSESQVVTREGRYSGPVGEFNNALMVQYTYGGCADAGLDSDIFLESVGVLRRSIQTIAGPRHFDLVYARLGSSTVITGPEVSFTLALDKAIYVANLMPPIDPRQAVPTMAARISWRNSTGDAVPMEFPDGQTFEMVIWSSEGRPVWRWSDGKAFTQAFRSEKWGPGERNWVEAVLLADPRAAGVSDRPLPEGRYLLEAYLTTGGKLYSATAGFQIVHAR